MDDFVIFNLFTLFDKVKTTDKQEVKGNACYPYQMCSKVNAMLTHIMVGTYWRENERLDQGGENEKQKVR